MSVTKPIHYFDTSALAKLVVEKGESPALFEWLHAEPRRIVTSDLSRTELLRAVRRVSAYHAATARTLLRACGTVSVSTDICDRAALLDPESVRSLDAIHLATALSLGDDLDSFVCYDNRLTEAANLNGLTTVAPE
ncbi:type II toxin-antitoxin system VapC family toxin [Leifsonia xyli]|uniref:type II toxin-antitoxin system VapC family toxin n=1 Tax=Leifsonia xyli TaxID=1575 RepID=UPI0009DC144D|nr:type II toxin-antitoxin system VapC family toxin [Leifsonia xyli]